MRDATSGRCAPTTERNRAENSGEAQDPPAQRDLSTDATPNSQPTTQQTTQPMSENQTPTTQPQSADNNAAADLAALAGAMDDPEGWTPSDTDLPETVGTGNPVLRNTAAAVKAGHQTTQQVATALGTTEADATQRLRRLVDNPDVPVHVATTQPTTVYTWTGAAGTGVDRGDGIATDGGQDPAAFTPDPQNGVDEWGNVKDMRARSFIHAIAQGFTTHSELAEAMDCAKSTVSRNVPEMAERDDTPIEKFKDGKANRYAYDASLVQNGQGGSQGTSTGQGDDEGDDGDGSGVSTDQDLTPDFPKSIDEYPAAMPDFRHDRDLEKHVPEGKPEYHPTGDEYRDLQKYARVIEQLDDSGAIDEPLALQMVGPTGCGKTHGAEKMAEERGWPVFEITLKDSMDPSDLEGYPNVLSALTAWTDGKFVKALLSTQVRPTVIILDEVNRAPASVRSVFMSALDSRASIELEARGGESVEADKSNMLVVSTRNPNDGDYQVYDLDPAQKDRLGKPHYIKYLGQEHPDREVDLLVNRKGVSEEFARGLIQAANEVREAADTTAAGGGANVSGGPSPNGGNGGGGNDDLARLVDRGVPTRTLLNMAQDAYLNGKAGIPNPAMDAVSGFLENMYEGTALDTVEQLFTDEVGGTDPVADNGAGLLDNVNNGNGGGA